MGAETLLDVGDDGLFGALALGLLGRGERLDLGLGGADGETLLDDQAGDLHAVGLLLKPEQNLGVTGRKLPLAEVAEDFAVELQETDEVGDAGAGLAEAIGDRFLREVEVAHQRGHADGLVDRVEVGPLQVLEERQHGAGGVTGFDDAHRDELLAELLEGAQATLAGDELVATLDLTHDDGLEQPLGADGLSEFLDGGLVELFTRLVRVGDDGGDRQFGHREGVRRGGRGGRGCDGGGCR